VAATGVDGRTEVTLTANSVVGSYSVDVTLGALTEQYALTNAPLGTTVALTSTAATLALTQSVDVTATVTSDPVIGPDPAGEVQFSVQGVVVGTVALTSSLTATMTLTGEALGAGTHAVTATYTGDDRHASSTSPDLAIDVADGSGGTPRGCGCNSGVPTEAALLALGAALLAWRRRGARA
jgi:hypothetical protein